MGRKTISHPSSIDWSSIVDPSSLSSSPSSILHFLLHISCRFSFPPHFIVASPSSFAPHNTYKPTVLHNSNPGVIRHNRIIQQRRQCFVLACAFLVTICIWNFNYRRRSKINRAVSVTRVGVWVFSLRIEANRDKPTVENEISFRRHTIADNDNCSIRERLSTQYIMLNSATICKYIFFLLQFFGYNYKYNYNKAKLWI